MPHLLLGAQEAFLVAPAVADPQVAAGPPQHAQDFVRLPQFEAKRLLAQYRFAELERPAYRRRVLRLRRRDDDGTDFRMADHIVIIMRVNIGGRDLRKRFGAGGISIGDRQKAYRRMFGRELSSQGPDAAGANHRDPQFRSRIAHFTPAPLLHSIPSVRNARIGSRTALLIGCVSAAAIDAEFRVPMGAATL